MTIEIKLQTETEEKANYLANVDVRPSLEELTEKEECEVFEIAQALEREHYFLTLRDTEELNIYDEKEGVYNDHAESIIKEELQNYFKTINSHKVNEVITKVRQRHYVNRNEFDADPDWLHVANGWINVDTLEFKRHDPDLYSLSKLAAAYDANATCPRYVKFLRETVEPDYIGTIGKILGYLLLKSSIYHKAFMFCGEGSNGKSTLINTTEAFLGKENRTTVSLQDITTNRFAKAELFGKRANLFGDIPSEKIMNTGDFKMLVSGDPIGAERKHQQRFTFNNYAKLIFSANQIPESSDSSYAYYRRWVIIPFTRVFEGDDADEQLLEKLTTDEELSGILNLALKGLKKLKAERGFKEVELDEIRRQYELGASRIKTFIEEKCQLEPGNESLKIESAALKEAYRKYCREHGTKYFDERKFGEELKALGVSHRQKMVSKRRTYYEVGITLKSALLNYLDKTATIPSKSKDNNIIEEIVSDSSKKLSNSEQSFSPNSEVPKE